MSSNLVKYEPSQFALLGNPEAAQLAISDNFADGGINPNYLDRVSLPAGGATFWQVETVEGRESLAELTGIIIWRHTARRFWPERDSNSEPPQCHSDDGQLGIGSPGGNCYTCPHNQWDSAGDGSKAKACTERRVLYLIRPSDVLPTVVDLSPSSIKGFEKYLVQLSSKGIPYFGAITAIGLTAEKGRQGNYSLATFRLVQRLSPGETEQMRSLSRTIADITARRETPVIERKASTPPRGGMLPSYSTSPFPPDRLEGTESDPYPREDSKRLERKELLQRVYPITSNPDSLPEPPMPPSDLLPTPAPPPAPIPPQPLAREDKGKIDELRQASRIYWKALKDFGEAPPNATGCDHWKLAEWEMYRDQLFESLAGLTKSFAQELRESFGNTAISADQFHKLQILETLPPQELVAFTQELNKKRGLPF